MTILLVSPGQVPQKITIEDKQKQFAYLQKAGICRCGRTYLYHREEEEKKGGGLL